MAAAAGVPALPEDYRTLYLSRGDDLHGQYAPLFAEYVRAREQQQ